MKSYPLLLASVVVLSSVSLADAAQKPPRKPNVIILMTDDQGYGDFSCHGNPVLKTPALDRLHASSVRFVDFHSAPMCTPSRGQILTGLDAVRNGATSVTAGRSFMRPGLLTLPQLLRMAGYKTGIFGKWHLGDNYPHRPMDRGFDEAVYHLGWGMTAAPEFVGKLFDGRYFHNGVENKFGGYMTDFWFDSAMQWMKQRREKEEPFFCYLPTNAPHSPHVVAQKYIDPYKAVPGLKAPGFFGMIANIDYNVARLENFLKTAGLYEDTIVIFMTDNGGTSGVPVFNAGLRGGKTTFYEGGHRVPGWVRWPAGGVGGDKRDIDVPAQMQDILPTVLDLCGAEPPAKAKFDGTSLAGLLRGTAKSLPERMMVVQYSRQALKKYECCVIWNQWRLVHGVELYDVKADRAQKNDLAAKHPEVLAKMKDHYEKWWAELEPLSKQWVPTSLGAKAQPFVPLTSSDWEDVYSDNAVHVSQAVGGPRGSHWNVLVEEEGDYEIAVRRWPAELDLPLTATLPPKAAPAKKDVRALPIAAAKLSIQGKEYASKADSDQAKEIRFRVSLQRGQTRLHAWFQDAAGQDLSGAFYAYVKRP